MNSVFGNNMGCIFLRNIHRDLFGKKSEQLQFVVSIYLSLKKRKKKCQAIKYFKGGLDYIKPEEFEQRPDNALNFF